MTGHVMSRESGGSGGGGEKTLTFTHKLSHFGLDVKTKVARHVTRVNIRHWTYDIKHF